MAKIVSRVDTDAVRLETLHDILVKFSRGVIGRPGEGATFTVGDTIEECLNQVHDMFLGQTEALTQLALQRDYYLAKLGMVQVSLDVAQDMLSNLVENIDYDEALDHAAVDLMDCFTSSGAANITADGELAFDERITFSKEDIKPYLRQAITSWVELRMAK